MRRTTQAHVKQLAKEMRRHPTSGEQELWDKIRNKQLGGYRFLRQYAISRYIADFYCSKAKTAVEVDGSIHEQDERKEYDSIREEVIKAHGIRIIRFTNEEIIEDINNVLKRLLEFLESESSRD
ncbi:very-short-patch-repair endonuclease [Anaerobacterium chartisolvens]|uniref:Very-short-patch-repair endonuclease n=1 Tax=Anaerobacterium chartisolvens TaxID=1297424 RepID=A0A369B9R7_9FIRM|nr:endonuclease domain-containing protein [Anaerobacterium chartisolvens]RCX18262.1 very-short-patch-repair endonuclease [Anaerobacterium chartisolvens]